jgi:antimicrobial peptide system SdpB family protein
MLTAIGLRARGWANEFDPFTNVYGVARTMMASALFGTLLVNESGTLFRPLAGAPFAPSCAGPAKAAAFCVAAPHFDLVRLVLGAVLLLVASGWRPRVTGVLHAYAAFSFQATTTALEGGDQVHAILALLLLPVTLMDDRKWHWFGRAKVESGAREEAKRLVARTCFFLIRLQVAGIYLHAAVGKWAVEEWSDGTVLYYWFTHPSFGAPSWLAPVIRFLVSHGSLLAALTWSIIVLELLLCAGIVAKKKLWPMLMWSGVALHAGIIVLHGLPSFSIIMWSALVLYLRPLDRPFLLPAFVTNHSSAVSTTASVES